MTDIDVKSASPRRSARGAAFAGMLLAMLLLCGGTKAWAQVGSPADCQPALNKDLISVASAQQSEDAFLNIIDDKTYDLLRHDASAAASLPITAGLISASADYSDFNEKRTAHFAKTNYSSSQAASYQSLQIVTSPVAYQAWSECMKAFAASHDGMFAYKVADNADVVVINYYFHPPFGITSASAFGFVTGGLIAGVPGGAAFPQGTVLLPSQGGTIQVQRIQNVSHMTVTVGATGFQGATIESNWDFSPPVFSGKATLSYQTMTTADGPPVPVVLNGNTSNNDSVHCPGGTCSPDGKWRATVINFTLHQPVFGQGRWANLNSSCSGGGGCAFVDWEPAPTLNGTDVIATGRAWSLPVTLTVRGDWIPLVGVPQEHSADTVIRTGGIFSVYLPPGSFNQLISVTYKGSTFALPLGADGPGRIIKFVSRSGSTYTYTVAQ